MRSFSVPPDTRAKERIFGGFFTATQAAFLGVGVALGLGTAVGLMAIIGNPIIVTIISVFVVLPFLPFVFIKKREMGDMELFFYLIYLIKFKTKCKKYPNINLNHRENWEV